MMKILIMGATSGIGLQLAREFASRGWMVGAAGRDTGALDILREEWPENVATRRIDVNDPDAAMEMGTLIGEMGGLDTYLHVAGIGFDNPSLEASKELATMETNVVGFTRMVGAAYRWLRDHNGGRGRIAAVTSVAGTDGIGQLAAYSASKRCQQAYLRALDQLSRLEGLAIRVTDIRPGWIRTPLLDDSRRYPMLMGKENAARKIFRAIEGGRRVAVIGWRWNILVGLWRLLPGWLWVRLPVRIPPVGSRRR